ncbi:MAG TPA: glycoside hydrolase family 16 protein [Pyrinomonadaceae bacterium]|nr:glycoside hydrolase family 16 protein [Pyrinomonadaceae bacterium]
MPTPSLRISRGRSRSLAFAFLSLALTLCLPALARGQKWRLAWGDEFDGAKGSGVDATKWGAEVGGHGWGNKELEYYTDGAKNAYLDGRGHLVIEAVKETLPPEFKCWYGQCRFTSARIITKNKFAQAYGRFEARIKVPAGQGVWPAFWLLGDDIDKAGWPACGEIDIVENIGREPSTAHGTMHGPGYSGAKGIGAPYTLPRGRRFADDFHTFAVEWEPTAIRWYVDGHLYETRTPADLPAGAKWVYDHPFFILLNFAVGGAWPGDPDETTAFPQTMLVDYVRVYKKG